ncbi:MAG TPA: hypothetical protein PK339_13985, partial [Flavitalea sp.]|nr:hypothetical protein [Flavitalea sp.]
SVGDNEYVKDRGYAFEQKLDRNTRGLMNRQLKDIADDEKNARVPLMIFNSVVTRDGRKMTISSQPVSFLMKPAIEASRAGDIEPDAIDFCSFFEKQDPLNLRLLTALRMNATFPYVLPNVWLPSKPVIDVMDAGLRDNYGTETALRFMQVFRKWINENTSGVALIQIRDRITGGWDHPFESSDVTEIVTKPFLILQYNWYKMQDYNQYDQLSYTQELFGDHFHRLSFQYVPEKDDAGAALNFHLTKREKASISLALDNENNAASFDSFMELLSKDSLKRRTAVAEKR